MPRQRACDGLFTRQRPSKSLKVLQSGPRHFGNRHGIDCPTLPTPYKFLEPAAPSNSRQACRAFPTAGMYQGRYMPLCREKLSKNRPSLYSETTTQNFEVLTPLFFGNFAPSLHFTICFTRVNVQKISKPFLFGKMKAKFQHIHTHIPIHSRTQ